MLDRTVELDGLVRNLAVERNVRAEYQLQGLDIPETLTDRIENMENRVRRLVRGELKAKLAELSARKEALTPAEIKLQAIDADIAELRKKLA